MTIFRQYAEYYDLLYADKDYAGEARFVLSHVAPPGNTPATLLELGCGSGRHAMEFARRGISVDGIDSSTEMISKADEKAKSLPGHLPTPRFTVADLCSVSLGREFDAVVALFHVFSYLTDTSALQAAFNTVARHLSPSGRALFDFWYGPAVLASPATVRVRRFRGTDFSATRIAEPEMRTDENCVCVHYEITIHPDADQRAGRVTETHRMRYLFLPEIVDLLSRAGLRIVGSGAWMSESALSRESWYGWVAAEHASR